MTFLRHTIITHGAVAMKEAQLEAARLGLHGRNVTTIAHAAARLAGGFYTPADDESLRKSLNAALGRAALGDLEPLKDLPGTTSAILATLNKTWLADLRLPEGVAGTAEAQARAAIIGELDAATRAGLRPNQLTPIDLLARALERVAHAPSVLGPITVRGVVDVAPVWQKLLKQLADHVPVEWQTQEGCDPTWLADTQIQVTLTSPREPSLTVISAANALAEATEAMRWVRELLASGAAKPHEIAIATTMVNDYDSYFLALRDDSSLPLHFGHGVPVVSTRGGQAAAALADAMARGLTRARLMRLLSNDAGPLIKSLPERWWKVLPPNSPIDRPDSWDRLLAQLTPESWEDGGDGGGASGNEVHDGTETLREIVRLVNRGLRRQEDAEEAGEALLSGQALAIWRQALANGPATVVDQTLERMRKDDSEDPTTSVVWLPAAHLVAAPRPFVRLLGLNSGAWPRRSVEDPLLPRHFVAPDRLDPMPAARTDRAHLDMLLSSSSTSVVLSFARHGTDGQRLGQSPLLSLPKTRAALTAVTEVARNRVPQHAFSETDRIMANPAECRKNPQAASATACWRDWHVPELTAHDGLIRPNHPLVEASLARRQSASSLSLLLRQPLGFVWRYALGIKDGSSDQDALVLDNLAIGNLLHMITSDALDQLQVDPELEPEMAVAVATQRAAGRWLLEEPTPPPQIWESQLEDIRATALAAIELTEAPEEYTLRWTEVPFGGEEDGDRERELPWSNADPVTIPGTGFTIGGRIDRIDLNDGRSMARVIDYKTGKVPPYAAQMELRGGQELQRSLYTYAVRQLIGEETAVVASLVYLQTEQEFSLSDPVASVTKLTRHLQASREALLAGSGLPGIDTAVPFQDHALALPAFPASYLEKKVEAVVKLLGPAAAVWEAP